MTKLYAFVLVPLVLTLTVAPAWGQTVAAPVFFIHAENDYSLSSGKVLDARREHIGKPHRLKVYPPIGHTVDDGHDFLYLGVNIWEPDVFAFLDENMRRVSHDGHR